MTSRLSPADRAELNQLWTELTNALRKIERLLGDDDPTGLFYSRDDETPAALVPPGVDGLSITGRPQRRPYPNITAAQLDRIERGAA